jgi:hypothetical protein
MKCRECDACIKGFWASQPESYICIGVPEPFVVTNRDAECPAYPKNRGTKVCKYCDKMDELYGDFRGLSVVDDMHTLRLQTYDRPRFNYCPMCGRKLTKEN